MNRQWQRGEWMQHEGQAADMGCTLSEAMPLLLMLAELGEIAAGLSADLRRLALRLAADERSSGDAADAALLAAHLRRWASGLPTGRKSRHEHHD